MGGQPRMSIPELVVWVRALRTGPSGRSLLGCPPGPRVVHQANGGGGNTQFCRRLIDSHSHLQKRLNRHNSTLTVNIRWTAGLDRPPPANPTTIYTILTSNIVPIFSYI